jgi:hypothetical protein
MYDAKTMECSGKNVHQVFYYAMNFHKISRWPPPPWEVFITAIHCLFPPTSILWAKIDTEVNHGQTMCMMVKNGNHYGKSSGGTTCVEDIFCCIEIWFHFGPATDPRLAHTPHRPVEAGATPQSSLDGIIAEPSQRRNLWRSCSTGSVQKLLRLKRTSG